jgi:hypothetical protein
VIAADNIRRFRALGGSVVYGTDLGNGTTVAAPNAEELAALEACGIVGDELIAATVHPAADTAPADVILVGEAPLPSSAAELAAWLDGSHRLISEVEVVA